jgi:hypothetical protein
MAAMTTGAPIRLYWWNTGLAPQGISRDDNAARYPTAGAVLRSLLEDDQTGLVALGETTLVDLAACLEVTGTVTSKLRWRTPRAKLERATALAVVYDPAKLTLLEERTLTGSWTRDTFTTGWHLTFEAEEKGEALEVVVVHWPSHLHEDSERRRKLIAASLHHAFREYADVLMLGDFNDEPFSDALRDGLAAYRDRDIVRRKQEACLSSSARVRSSRVGAIMKRSARAARRSLTTSGWIPAVGMPLFTPNSATWALRDTVISAPSTRRAPGLSVAP